MTGVHSSAFMLLKIDAKNHLLGCLASVVAKELLNGTEIIVAHCEQINITGTHHNVKERYLKYFQKRCNYNRTRGQFHYRAPEKIFEKTVKRMLPMNTHRGEQALKRLRCYAGIPKTHPTGYVVVPQAMRVLRLRETSDYCVLGDVASEIGWKRAEDVAHFDQKYQEQDDKRRQEYAAKYENAQKNPDIAKLNQELKKYGYGF